MDRDRAWLLKEKYNGVENAQYFADCARLEAGEPLAYLIGNIPFLDTVISLASYPLIPRPETEHWVNTFITEHRNLTQPIRILDLCAGSGCIGVAVGKALPTASIDFAELDERHFSTIKANCLANGLLEHQFRIVVSDLFSQLPDATYDYILTNPPYIDASLGRVATSVKDHEPALALYGGPAGLTLTSRIIEAAPQHLTPRGELWIEHEPEQAVAIATLGNNAGFEVRTHEDQYGVPRYSKLVLQ